MTDRLAAISRCMDELELCRSHRLKYAGAAEALHGITLGELDWLTELHRLLYDEGELAMAML